MSDHLPGIIIQARTGSTRLPNKMILDFNEGKGIFEIIIDKLAATYQGVLPLILATTQNPADQILVDIAQKKGLRVFCGDENNVLDRFIKAAEKFHITGIIRVCADNPFLDVKHIDNYLKTAKKQSSDYISYAFSSGKPVIQSHLGLFTEYVGLPALKKAAEYTQNPLYLEHVTNYIYTHPEKFDLNFLALPSYLDQAKEIRLTLDTAEDFALLQSVYSGMIKQKMSTENLVHWLKQQPALLEQMHKNIQKNQK